MATQCVANLLVWLGLVEPPEVAKVDDGAELRIAGIWSLANRGFSGRVDAVDEMVLAKEALRLPPRERALLADSLLASLDSEEFKKIETEWVGEADERLKAYRKGELTAEDGPEVLKSLKDQYGK